MARISIQDMAKAIIAKHGLAQRDAEDFVTALFDVINEGLNSEKAVKVKGLGTFKVIDVRERESVNVNTGERVVIESHGKITFTPDPVMRDLVNKPFAQFETVVLNDGVDLEEMGRIQDDVDDNTEAVDDIPETKANEVDVQASATDETVMTKEPVVPTEDDVEACETEATPHGSVDDNEPEIDADITDAHDIEQPESVNAASVDMDMSVKSAEEENGHIDYEVEDSSFVVRHKAFLTAVLVLLVGVGAFIGGYYWGRYSVEPMVETQTVYITKKPAMTVEKADTVHHKDTVAVEKAASLGADTVKQVKANIGADKDFATPSAEVSNSPEYKNAIAIMNTGAYRIVGTAQTVTVKHGETLKGISKFYLGDGMECYIQVHNGIVNVKEGMKLKIPKLENKLKRKSR